MKKLLFTILGMLCCALTTSATLINVSGDVSGTWSADTVMVIGEIRVVSSQILTINPGVLVRFTGLYKFIVNGRLNAVASAADSIIFTRAYATEESKWRGFRFDGADAASILEYCRIEWAKGEGAYPDVRGGVIWINNCAPTVRHCLIAHGYTHNGNYNGAGGGICCNDACNSVIEYNRIALNQSDSGGGILVGSNCNPTINHNLIENNQAFYAGGGIYVSADAQSTISGNIIRNNNSGGYGGGGINLWSATWLYGAYSLVYDNLIMNNTASDAGGGIYSRYETSQIYENTLVGNTASRGGGLYVLTFSNLPPYVFSDVFWNNSAPTGAQIYLDPVSGSTATIEYCDVQDGWSGVGNIQTDPAFVNTLYNDYRLHWGSPCIDTGHPSPQYFDPDGTRSDMGAYYYDQSVPVRILLTPHTQPVEIPASGGSFDFTLQATNLDSLSHSTRIWCQARLPNGQMSPPLVGPAIVTLGAGITVSRQRTQTLPANAPAGVYVYYAYAVAGVDTSQDSFVVVKLGAQDDTRAKRDWTNLGDDFGEADIGAQSASRRMPLQPESTLRLSNYPNPANPTTAIKFTLPLSGQVKLQVFDMTGRRVANLIDGFREGGAQEVIFDGSGLGSGVYLYKLEAGGFTNVQKMVLLK